jgi:hypothetical protein
MAVHAVAYAAQSDWWPTQKWWAATITALGGFLTTWATQGWQWSPTYSGAAITLVTQRVVAYLVKNSDPRGAA